MAKKERSDQGLKQISKRYVFGFQDEVGLLHTPKEDRVFGLGLLKLHHPQHLHRAIIAYKNSKGFHKELKFSDIREHNLSLYKGLIDIFFKIYQTYFNCLIFDKTQIDIEKFFNRNHSLAYNAFSARLVADSLDKGEYIAVIADDVSTPKSDNFERDVKRRVKAKAKRNALFGICRVESHAVSEIQMVDVLLGTVAYTFKIKYGLVKPNSKNPKFRLMKYLGEKLNRKKLAESFRVRRKGTIFCVSEFMKGPSK